MEDTRKVEETQNQSPAEELEIEALTDEDLDSAAGGYCSAAACSTAPQ